MTATTKPAGVLNHWRAEAEKLPVASMVGERIVSPGGVLFQARATQGYTPSQLCWEACIRDWVPTGFLFRATPIFDLNLLFSNL